MKKGDNSVLIGLAIAQLIVLIIGFGLVLQPVDSGPQLSPIGVETSDPAYDLDQYRQAACEVNCESQVDKRCGPEDDRIECGEVILGKLVFCDAECPGGKSGVIQQEIV